MKKLSRRHFMQLSAGLTASSWFGAALTRPATATAAFNAVSEAEGTRVSFANVPDRIWLGAEFWANPMEDWSVRGGRIECDSMQGNRNVHLLTHQLSDRMEPFTVSVRTGVIEAGELGGTGLRLGIHDQVNDYRGNCVWGPGVDAGVANGNLVLLGETKPIAGGISMKDLLIEVAAEPAGEAFRVTLSVTDNDSGKPVGTLRAAVPASALIGNVAVVNNFSAKTRNGSRFWYDDWRLSGDKFDVGGERAFGPILWAMHTLSNSRSDDGYEFKLTAQMPPLGEADRKTVTLEIQRDGQWQTFGEETIHPDARTAIFAGKNWDPTADVPYRLTWTQVYTDGTEKEHEYKGTIRKEPKGRPLVLAGMTCQQHTAFPYGPVPENLAKLDPDVLFFSGDQVYEENGHFGFIRFPAEKSIICYLRKWYMFGWTFRDVMRDRPTLCIPDDHDVFQANLWGEAGAKMPPDESTAHHGGYIQPVRMLEVVHTTNCGHHPSFFDPTPVKRGISVYYGDMVYGRTSFAIVSDKQWKSGPEEVRPDEPQADWVRPGVDVSTLDQPGLVLFGDRQEKFLEHWVQDWRGADMKVLLSETLLGGCVTHHGRLDRYLQADLDAGGWPQTPRNHALRIVRKGFPVHVSGDQHLGLLVQYGTDDFRDGCWSFCTPAVSVGYQRWWLPDEVGRSHTDRPEHGLPNTGQYLDGFNHPTYVYAVANPPGSQHPNRYTRAELKASGFGIVRIDPAERTYTFESYRFDVDVDEGLEQAQFPGWPHTVNQLENYGRQRFGELPAIQAPSGVTNPVVKVLSDDGDLVYALRVSDGFKPFVFEDGTYTVIVGDPDADEWTRLDDQRPTKA